MIKKEKGKRKKERGRKERNHIVIVMFLMNRDVKY